MSYLQDLLDSSFEESYDKIFELSQNSREVQKETLQDIINIAEDTEFGKSHNFADMGIINPSYGSKVKDKLLLPMEVSFLLPETYYLYRDLQVLKGASENQLKPVRVIDTPAKESFFFALIDHEI